MDTLICKQDLLGFLPPRERVKIACLSKSWRKATLAFEAKARHKYDHYQVRWWYRACTNRIAESLQPKLLPSEPFRWVVGPSKHRLRDVCSFLGSFCQRKMEAWVTANTRRNERIVELGFMEIGDNVSERYVLMYGTVYDIALDQYVPFCTSGYGWNMDTADQKMFRVSDYKYFAINADHPPFEAFKDPSAVQAIEAVFHVATVQSRRVPDIILLETCCQTLGRLRDSGAILERLHLIKPYPAYVKLMRERHTIIKTVPYEVFMLCCLYLAVFFNTRPMCHHARREWSDYGRMNSLIDVYFVMLNILLSACIIGVWALLMTLVNSGFTALCWKIGWRWTGEWLSLKPAILTRSLMVSIPTDW
uniref:F-box domain-containing protein n=1 Tax=Lotharella globosa TaxID=91324 RepID=A0A7S3Y976_9EUKA|mmetsp:Transcript_14675/g.29703  ORF Transcript_14675/g.29703 Transcript_14675/m.29703 type:complete len:362 (+) Transcript_14675:146-1231(+)